MRLITVRQPEVTFMVAGARIYHAMPSTIDVPQLVAIHAAAEAPSWAEIERRAESDTFLRRCLWWHEIKSAEEYAELVRGGIIGIMRVVEVLDAREYDDPPLTPIAGKRWLWHLEPVRVIEPVMCTARPNAWTMPDELVRKVEAAPEGNSPGEYHGNPPGLGREVFPRGDWRWKIELARRVGEVKDIRGIDIDWKLRDPLNWNLQDGAAERMLRRDIAGYINSHDTRDGPVMREVMVDRRIPIIKRLFPDAAWVTLHEFERRVRYDAYTREYDQLHAYEEEIAAAEEAVEEAREELRRREHEYRLLTDQAYAREEAERQGRDIFDEAEMKRESTRHERDSWNILLREDTARRIAAGEREPPKPDDAKASAGEDAEDDDADEFEFADDADDDEDGARAEDAEDKDADEDDAEDDDAEDEDAEDDDEREPDAWWDEEVPG